VTGSPIDLTPLAAGTFDARSVTVRLNVLDDVVIARVGIAAGCVLGEGTETITTRQVIAPGHKIAVSDREVGEPIRRYGQVIGFATKRIRKGDHVHSHNLAVGDLHRDYAFSKGVIQVDRIPPEERASFLGYRRPQGRTGTRNYVAVISSVNCSASVSKYIAERFNSQVLEPYPHVDGVMAIIHKSGCGEHHAGPEGELLQRVLGGFALHPNVAAYVLVGLGCESNQIPGLVESRGLGSPPTLIIQDEGGLLETVEAGVRAVAEVLPQAEACRRERVSASELTVALQCGGSDAWSGVTANPALGYAADLLVEQDGTVVLGETPEVYGAEHLLTRRAVSEAVGRKLLDRIEWWERYTAANGAVLDNNPAPGNKVGGLTTIFEKSLGAIAKCGTTPMVDVLGYAEQVRASGFVHMDTPGYDPVSVTGQVAGGCNLVAFTTGRGSVFGCRPAPTLKIATTSDLARRMQGDMDIDAGPILDGKPVAQVGREIFDMMLDVASGMPTKSERHGIGEEEFNPWIIGAIL
jgi:altronate hydrolase